MNRKRVTILLTGGLGNQLFQFAAGLEMSIREERELWLDISSLKPRSDKSNVVELLGSNLQDFISGTVSKSNLIEQKGFNFLLASKRVDRWRYSFSWLNAIVKIILKLALALKHRSSSIHFFVPDEIGGAPHYCEARHCVLIGYFQSHFFFESNNVKTRMQELKFTSDVVMEPWQELSNIEKPIVVHIRRGDYKYEDQFGLLSRDYYSRAIAEIDDLSASSYGVVWLFSDEMEIAKQILLDIGRPIRYFGAEFSTKSAFELMRLGHAFIIANSSFSYWAAALAHKFDVMVICPNPWFIGIDSSANLIPPRWHSIDRGANGY